jgi:hypothetical protein
MKREIAKYIYLNATLASHLMVPGTLQPLPIPSWKWEDLSMDFIVGLPNTSQNHDSIWVIVDRLTKTTHFLPVHTTHRAEKYAEIYIDQIVRLHGIPRTIVSGRGAPFVARFWEQLQVTWNPCNKKLSVPSSDRWSDRKGKSDFGRHVEGMCAALWEELGQVPFLGGILL